MYNSIVDLRLFVLTALLSLQHRNLAHFSPFLSFTQAMVFFEPGKVKRDLEVPPALKGLSLRGISNAFCNISNLQIGQALIEGS